MILVHLILTVLIRKNEKLFNDIMNREKLLSLSIRESGVELTRHIITSLYDMGADPKIQKKKNLQMI